MNVSVIAHCPYTGATIRLKQSRAFQNNCPHEDYLVVLLPWSPWRTSFNLTFCHLLSSHPCQPMVHLY